MYCWSPLLDNMFTEMMPQLLHKIASWTCKGFIIIRTWFLNLVRLTKMPVLVM